MSDKAIKATTQSHLDIHTIKDHLVILKDGSVAIVLQTSAINFGLLSEEEQDATIYGYAALLNSLSFTVQVLLRSTRKDISDYVERLDTQLETIRSQKIKEQIIKYRTYIKSLVKENKVMEKKFYVIVPFTAIELGLSVKSFNPLAPAPQKPTFEDNYILEKAKISLYPRRDHLIRQFARLGLQTRQLTTQELLTLFYRIYNPDVVTPPFLVNPKEFETTAVQVAPVVTPIQISSKILPGESTPPPQPTNIVFKAPGSPDETTSTQKTISPTPTSPPLASATTTQPISVNQI